MVGKEMTDEIEKFLDDITRKSSISIAMSNPAWLSRFAAETAIKADKLGKENLHLCSRIAELEAALRPFTDVESIVPFFHDAGWGLYAHVVTKRDMEAARKVLGEKE
jgi:hypothetical protein